MGGATPSAVLPTTSKRYASPWAYLKQLSALCPCGGAATDASTSAPEALHLPPQAHLQLLSEDVHVTCSMCGVPTSAVGSATASTPQHQATLPPCSPPAAQ
jgi:hypothetical protein